MDSRHVIFVRHIVVFSRYMCISTSRPEKNILYLASLSVLVSQVTRGRTSLRCVTNVLKSLNKTYCKLPSKHQEENKAGYFSAVKEGHKG